MSQSNFFQKVYDVVQLIPVGRVTTYGAIARSIGSPQSARMVGWALNSSKHAPRLIPAHRVVNRNGMLTGKRHFQNQNTMAELIASEGIRVEDDKIINFNEVFWDPLIHLETDF